MKNKLDRFLAPIKDNRGSGMITVLITMFFVGALGMTILYMSYTGFLIRAAQQEGVDNFYDSTELMDRVLAGFEEITSDSIAIAYQNTAESSGAEEEFKELFRQTLFSWKTPDSSSKDLVSALSPSVYEYDVEALAYFLTRSGASIDDISVTDTEAPIYLSGSTVEYDDESIIFKDILIQYTNPQNNIQTTVSSDIVINYPGYYAPQQSIDLNFSEAGEFVLIAAEELTNEPTLGTSLTGNAYAGNVSFSGSTAVSFENGALVSAGNVNVDNTLNLNGSESSLWAQDITLGNNANFTLQGSAYVADDLELRGNNSSATISGSYYGYGDDLREPEQSSSIIVNGVDSSLDLENSQRLMLAGHSFVSPGGTSTEHVLMGESISVRTNQMAYLIPAENINVAAGEREISTNPYVVGITEALPVLGDNVFEIQTLIYPIPGANKHAVYYFYKFDTREEANDFFKEYFTLNKDYISMYLNLYTELSLVSGYVDTSGHYVENSGDAVNGFDYTITDEFEVSAPDTTSTDFMSSTYANLCSTLSVYSSSAHNPYEYIVDEAAVKAFLDNNSGNTFNFTKDGEVVAILAKNNFNMSAVPQSVKLVLVVGDDPLAALDNTVTATINRDFTGQVVSQGSIKMQAENISGDAQVVKDAYASSYTDGTLFGEFFDIVSDSSQAGGSGGSWDVNELVNYEDWTKS